MTSNILKYFQVTFYVNNFNTECMNGILLYSRSILECNTTVWCYARLSDVISERKYCKTDTKPVFSGIFQAYPRHYEPFC